MIAEAIDTVIALGWALLAWIAVLAAVASIVLLAGTAVGMWAVRGAWRVFRRRARRPVGAREATDGPLAAEVPESVPRLPGARDRRPAPRWALPSDDTQNNPKPPVAA